MKPDKPSLWDATKRKYRATDKGTPKGKWGASKAVLAKRDYQRKGGRWVQSTTPPKSKKADPAG